MKYNARYRNLMMDSLPASLLLSYIVWRGGDTKEVCLTDDEILIDTLITRSELRSAKEILKSRLFVEFREEGKLTKTYYKIDKNELEKEFNCE